MGGLGVQVTLGVSPPHGQGTPHPITRQSLAKGYPRGRFWLSLSTGKAGCQGQPAFW